MAQFILVVGNAVDGLRFIGPFTAEAEAVEYAGYSIEDTWCVSRMTRPPQDGDVELHYRCRAAEGDMPEEDIITGRWTGERDHVGKRTFETNDGRTLYLFDDEVIEDSSVEA